MRIPRIRMNTRRMMAAVLVVAAALGWVIHRARVQAEAVEVIRQAGGQVAFDRPWSPFGPTPAPPPRKGPVWLRRSLGRHFFDTATSVDLGGPQFGDDSLRAACRLGRLEELVVVQTNATDAGAEGIGRLTDLRSLDLRLNRFTPRVLPQLGNLTGLRELKLAMKLSPVPLRDDDLTFLRRLTRLEHLMLPSKDLTGAWLVHIEGLTGLDSLELYDMAIGTADLARLRGLVNLTNLSLHGSRVTSLEPLRPLVGLTSLCVAYAPIDDDDLAALAALPSLRRLDLRRTNVTDAGLATLATLPALGDLDLDGAKVTDAGLEHLAASKTLRSVRVGKSAVTDAAIAASNRAHPQVDFAR